LLSFVRPGFPKAEGTNKAPALITARTDGAITTPKCET
jgi:hypothetical protein